jgi:hypothetical protein
MIKDRLYVEGDMAKKPLAQAVQDLELTLAKYKSVVARFPDAVLSESWLGYKNQFITSYSSKMVNSQYNKIGFEPGYGGIVAVPYCELTVTHDNVDHLVKVNSIPKSSRLVYIPWREKVIKFSRLSFNLKNNNFKDDMLNACRVEIMNFIQKHPGYKLDEKYLEPRLKKLLLFT